MLRPSVGLYSCNYSENGDPAAVKQFSWIPNTILLLGSATREVQFVFNSILPVIYESNSRFSSMAVEPILSEYIFPLPANNSSKGNDLDETVWTDRLLTIMRHLDEKAINILLAVSGIKSQ